MERIQQLVPVHQSVAGRIYNNKDGVQVKASLFDAKLVNIPEWRMSHQTVTTEKRKMGILI